MSPDRASFSPKSRAFTLLELMVVVGIIGLLIAAVLVGVPKIKRAVYGAQTQAQLSALAGAIQQYYNDYHAYPGPIANSQLGTGYDNSPAPFIGNPLTPIYLTGTSGSSAGTMSPTADASSLNTKAITGAENLVLGLCGGLRVYLNASGKYVFEYHPEDLFALDGTTLTPHGPPSLNPAFPKKQQAYIALKPGDLSVPNNTINNGLFTDSANRYGQDSMIPEFMDKYSDPLPILYYRTNPGGTAIVGFRNLDKINGSPLVDNNTSVTSYGTPPNQVAQYDLLQNLGYVDNTTGRPEIGVIASNVASKHGLVGIGNMNDPIDINAGGTYAPYFYDPNSPTVPPTGKNALAYFKDPVLNDPANSSNVHLGVARQKDGYLLISAGADRQYGTRDDQIFPGPLLPAQ